nr:TRAP transporter small permease [Azospirillum endophyticum]
MTVLKIPIEITERLMNSICSVLIFLIMVIVTADVLMRYIFTSPLSWSYDMIGMYLMPGLFFLIMSKAYISGSHVNVDVISARFPRRLHDFSEILIASIGTLAFALIAIAGAERGWDGFLADEVLAGSIPWPTWPAPLLVALGSSLIAARFLLSGIAHAQALALGSPVDSALTVAATHAKEGFE